MKKCILFAMLLVGAGLACKKGNSGGSFHVTATINGKNETFNVSAVATRLTIAGATHISIGGLATSTPTGEAVQMQLASHPGGPAIKVGTYTDTTTQYDLVGIYWVDVYHGYLAGTSIYQGSLGGASAPVTNHFKLVITAMDSSSIKGSFSGDYYAAGSTDSAKKTVTNGDFYVQMH
jgi:hypothetical protein